MNDKDSPIESFYYMVKKTTVGKIISKFIYRSSKLSKLFISFFYLSIDLLRNYNHTLNQIFDGLNKGH